jgi:hypothetical protein
MRTSLLLLLCFVLKQSFAQNISGVVNEYRKVLWADSAKGAVKLSNVSGFGSYVGRKVMLVQMKGAVIDQSNGATFGDVSDIASAGYYEIGTICGFLQDTLILERKLNNFYDVTGFVQCVIFPDISGNATVTDTLKAQPWDSVSGTGGIIALDVPGTLTLNKPIDASGAGFRGGIYQAFTVSCTFTLGVTSYYYPNTATNNSNGGPKGEGIAAFVTARECGRGKQANGGGGGNNHNSGGGGGSNYGAGGKGGNRTGGTCSSNTPGLGGFALSGYGYATSPGTQNRIFMGGGGGCGQDNNTTGTPGGHGGGIVYIKADRMEGGSATAANNKIMANGTKSYRFITAFGFASNDAGSDGAGGGGAGGTILLHVNSYAGNSIAAEATGGAGSGTESFGQNQCSGPGGGGGGGVVWFKQASLPAGITSSATGGSNGVTSGTASCPNSANTATAGGAGATLFNFALAAPRDTTATCRQLVPLYVNADISGYQLGNRRFITARVSHQDYIQACILQKAATPNTFTDLMRFNGNGQAQYQFTDVQDMDNIAIYRIKLITKDGHVAYSSVLRMAPHQVDKNKSLHVYPNPSRQKMSLQVFIQTAGLATIAITNNLGQPLWQQRQWLSKGYHVLPLAIGTLPVGVHTITVTTTASAEHGTFIKLAP